MTTAHCEAAIMGFLHREGGEANARSILSGLLTQYREDTLRECIWRLISMHEIDLTESRTLRIRRDH